MKTLRIEYTKDDPSNPHRITSHFYKITGNVWEKVLIGEFKNLMRERGEGSVEIVCPEGIPRLNFIPTSLFDVH